MTENKINKLQRQRKTYRWDSEATLFGSALPLQHVGDEQLTPSSAYAHSAHSVSHWSAPPRTLFVSGNKSINITSSECWYYEIQLLAVEKALSKLSVN